MEIYVVTRGEYSDYRIEAIYRHRPDAEKALVHLGDADIEEWDLLDEFALVETHTVTIWRDDRAERHVVEVTLNGGGIVGSTYQGSHASSARALTYERAKKIAQDNAAWLKAKAAYIT